MIEAFKETFSTIWLIWKDWYYTYRNAILAFLPGHIYRKIDEEWAARLLPQEALITTEIVSRIDNANREARTTPQVIQGFAERIANIGWSMADFLPICAEHTIENDEGMQLILPVKKEEKE